MPFITLTLAINESDEKGQSLVIRRDDVRVLEARSRQILMGGEWKPAEFPGTLVTLFSNTSYMVTESVADILKQLENIPS